LGATVGYIALLVLFLAPAGLSQTPEEFLQSFVGQKLILRHIGDRMGAKVKKNDLAHVKGSCDVAVQVREAAWRKGTARFSLEEIGTPNIYGKQSTCTERHDEHMVEITGFENNQPTDSLAASVRALLQTPDQYLTAQGIKFDYPPASEDTPLSKAPPPLTQPRTILSVDPTYSKQGRQEKFQGTVACTLIVGADGRVYRPKLAHVVGHGLDEQALRIISMWRFEPARQLDKPVAVTATISVNFRLY